MNLASETNRIPEAYSQRILPFLRRYNVPESVLGSSARGEVFREFDLQGLDLVIAVFHTLQGALEVHVAGGSAAPPGIAEVNVRNAAQKPIPILAIANSLDALGEHAVTSN